MTISVWGLRGKLGGGCATA